MTRKHVLCVRWFSAALVVTFAAIGLMLFWLLYPYDLVTFRGDPGLATPKVVEQGGVVTVTRDEFCNNGTDISVHRWADRYDSDGNVTASFDLGIVEFYNLTGEPVCFSPSSAGITLPNFVVGPNGSSGVFRLRLVTTYKPNPIRTVEITTTSTPFTVLPAKEPSSAP